MRVEIVEIASSKDSTASMMYIDGSHFCFVIEDGYRETKIPGETRIPAGYYHLQPRYYGKFYEKYKHDFGHEFSIEIVGIENYSDVLVHIGNSSADTRGCPLTNQSVGVNFSTGDYFGINSTEAYKRFYNKVAPELKAGRFVSFIVLRSRPDSSPPKGSL